MRATRWPAVWAVFAGGLVCGAFIGKVPPALPAQREELGLTLVESGFIATTFNVIGLLVGMFVGVLCDRFGHKRLGLAGIAVMSLAGLLGAAAWDFPSLLASRFLEGVGFILFTVAGSALMAASAAGGGSASAYRNGRRGDRSASRVSSPRTNSGERRTPIS
ncbi:MAG: MFS transporter, partial [Burkholderiales bacterium]